MTSKRSDDVKLLVGERKFLLRQPCREAYGRGLRQKRRASSAKSVPLGRAYPDIGPRFSPPAAEVEGLPLLVSSSFGQIFADQAVNDSPLAHVPPVILLFDV